jgi:hypothetical protein
MKEFMVIIQLEDRFTQKAILVEAESKERAERLGDNTGYDVVGVDDMRDIVTSWNFQYGNNKNRKVKKMLHDLKQWIYRLGVQKHTKSKNEGVIDDNLFDNVGEVDNCGKVN